MVKLGIHPINWSNDDFHELGGDTPLNAILQEMRAAEYTGTELGHKFPKDAQRLRSLLRKYSLTLISGWHSTYFIERSLKVEVDRFYTHLLFLKEMGCKVAIVAECGQSVYTDRGTPLPKSGVEMSEKGWQRLVKGLIEIGEMALAHGIYIVYHPHVGTVIQTDVQLSRLMAETRSPVVNLLADSGHMALAGMDPLTVFNRFSSRIRHVHFKDTRRNIVGRVWQESFSFEHAVKSGVFTVPGDGEIDFQALIRLLQAVRYTDWIVVEAEQDPKIANPLHYAQKAMAHMKSWRQ